MTGNRSSVAVVILFLTVIAGLGVGVYFGISGLKETARQKDTCFPGLSEQTSINNQATTQYFPPSVFSKNKWQDQYASDWYSKHLKAMQEPSLYDPSNSEKESYRFLWLRSFDHPVAIRLFRSSGTPTLTVKELDGTGGHEPGHIILDKTRSIPESEWKSFRDVVEHQCYWRLANDNDKSAGNDGAQWILEAAREGRYHVVDRWSPSSGDYRELGLYLLKLAGLEGEKIY